jgi:hypothetical protein
MTRTIRPIGPVTSALKRHGYRQQAVILVDGEQVPNLTVLSKKIGDKIRFVGHYIDDSGEIHVTKPMVDMKKAASRIMTIRQGVLDSTPVVAARKPYGAEHRRHDPMPRLRQAPQRRRHVPGGLTP